jgi:hypothetical protein
LERPDHARYRQVHSRTSLRQTLLENPLNRGQTSICGILAANGALLTMAIVILMSSQGCNLGDVILVVLLSSIVVHVPLIFDCRRRSIGRNRLGWICLGALAGAAVTAATQWPLRLSFLLSTSSAEQAARGDSVVPGRIGWIWVSQFEREDKAVYLWTHIKDSGRSGFVLSPGSLVKRERYWYTTSLGGDWWFVVED